MKKYLYTIITLFAAFLTSCSIQESETTIKTNAEEPEFYASIEDASTRVFADENLSVLWNADDRVSIFNKNTYNQQYKFLGETGDNAGGFNKVDVAEFVTGKPIANVVSVYPYQEDTKISEDGVLTVTLPAEQIYSENTFGMGTNMMVSVSSDNFLQYKNVGGYLRLKLYGESVAISSITIVGNYFERISGKASITMPLDGIPSIEMASDANTEITLSCKKPVLLGSTPEKSTDFWFVLPPVTFNRGFTIIVKKKNGQAFTKKTINPISITRNNLLNMAPFEVEMEGAQPNNVIYYTTSDSTLLDVSGLSGYVLSNVYQDGLGIITLGTWVNRLELQKSFYNCTNLTSISLPNTITSIGAQAFYGCQNLSSIKLPDTMQGDIGKNAFYGCTKLTSIDLPDNLGSIGQSAFQGCSSLASITFPDTMNGDIGVNAFNNCSKLVSVELPDNLGSIGQSAFQGCSGLISVDLPDNLRSIGQSAFQGCSSLISVDLPESITSIDSQAFAECRSLESINLPNSLGIISREVFKNCNSLININIPKSVTRIEASAFRGCTSLIEITIPNGVIWIGGAAFQDCISLSRINIPNGITMIDNATFWNCSNLTSITIPGSVTKIGVWTFRDCSKLTNVIIPEGVTSIGQEAFLNCSSLERINVRAKTPPEGAKDMFTNTGLCPIYIPSGSEDAYLNAEYWKHYALRLRTEGSNSSIAYCSSDYSKDGEVVKLQQASVGRGINIIFLGDGFLDKDMAPGGKYETKMREAMEQFFAYEPYYSHRNRFNIYTVKVVSKNDIYLEVNSDRALTYEEGDSLYYRTGRSTEYSLLVPNPYNQPLKICTICNTNRRVGRSYCSMGSDGWASCVIKDVIGPVLNHEIGGHGFGLLWDEYVEKDGTYNPDWRKSLDELYEYFGFGANVDWRSNPNEVRWARFLKDPRYAYEGLGVYEGGYLYAHGIYRATENSMMRYNDTPFNAPSREQIYKTIMKYSEGEDWVYDYEEFVKADERGRMEAAEELGPWKSPHLNTRSQIQAESQHHPPVLIDNSVKAVGIDKDGNVILVR